MPDLSRFLLELDRPQLRAAEIQALGARSRSVTAQMRVEGATVRFLRTIYVPEDGRCYLLFEGQSEGEVGEAASRAGVAFGRLVAATNPELPQQ
jgi:hypothetical protein